MIKFDTVEVGNSFGHCPGCGASATNQSPDPSRKFSCSACDYVLYFNPGSAVAAILHAPDGRVLFLRRQRDPGKGMLGLPGGFIDPGESGEEALTREVAEETGLKITQWRYLGSYPNIYSYRGLTYRVTDMFFVCPILDFGGISLDLSESAAWMAIDPADAVARAAFAFESNRRAVENYMQRLPEWQAYS